MLFRSEGVKDPRSEETKKKVEDLERERLRGNRQQIDAAQAAATELQAFGGALQALTKWMDQHVKTGPEAEKFYQDAAAVGDFKKGAELFLPAAQAFKEGVEKLTGNKIKAIDQREKNVKAGNITLIPGDLGV